MKFSDMENKMKRYEVNGNYASLPEVCLIIRADGRGFSKLTKETHKFDAPFDERMRTYMTETTLHLMQCGFNVLYGYTQSDEISLLLELNDDTFNRKHRKINSIIAGEASAKFSLLLGAHGAFDCRVTELPNSDLVVDYFRWRQEDASRNCLGGYAYWKLRESGMSKAKATSKIAGMSLQDKNEMLFQLGINYNDVPSWQKRGTGFYWQNYDKKGFNPQTNEEVIVQRRKIITDFELPMGLNYEEMVYNILAGTHPNIQAIEAEKHLKQNTFRNSDIALYAESDNEPV